MRGACCRRAVADGEKTSPAIDFPCSCNGPGGSKQTEGAILGTVEGHLSTGGDVGQE